MLQKVFINFALISNVTETQSNPQTGEQETVVVRQESNFWTPFAGAATGAIAGQALGSLLFRPQYYVPPVYHVRSLMFAWGNPSWIWWLR